MSLHQTDTYEENSIGERLHASKIVGATILLSVKFDRIVLIFICSIDACIKFVGDVSAWNSQFMQFKFVGGPKVCTKDYLMQDKLEKNIKHQLC